MASTDPPTSWNRRLFAWWADRPWLQLVVLVVMSGSAAVGHLKPELIRDLPAAMGGVFAATAAAEPNEPKPARTAPEQKAAEQKTPEQKTPQQKTPEQKTPEQKPAEQKAAEPKPPEQLPARVDRTSDVRPFQVAGGECVVVARSENLFTRENLVAIRRVVEKLDELPQVSRVLWLDSIPGLNLFGLPEPLLPRNNASERQMEYGRKRTLENPLAVGQLISSDGTTVLLHLRMDWFFVTSDSACTTQLREVAEAAAATVPGADLQFQVTGRAPLHLMMADNHLQDSWRYQLIGYTIMIVAAVVLFRGLAAVLIVAVAPALGVFWTMGFLHFFDLQDNPFNDIIVPVLISLVGIADAVHLMVEVRNQRARGLSVREAARTGVARVGLACALTSLTTAIGFASLAWAHHEIVREFGWCCVLGVGLTFLSVLTVVPLGCRSPLGRRLHVGLGTSLIDRQLRRLGPLVAGILRRDRLVAGIAVMTTVALIAVCTRLRPDERRYSGLSESGEAAQALRHLDRVLGGLEFGQVKVSWSEQVADGQLLEVLAELDRALDDEPLIGHPLGLHQLLEVLPGDGTPGERMTLLDLLPPPVKRAFYVPENREATVQFRVQDLGIAQYGPVFQRLEQQFARIQQRYPEFQLRLEGDAVWRWRHVYQIVVDLATSLGTASIVIWLILTIAYRSLRLGLISIVPNVFPIVATGAMLVAVGQRLELVTVCVFTICVGIAVDDTIHFLTRYTEELEVPGTHSQVIERAFSGVGSALVMTTIVLVTGMLTAVFGDARDARLFGYMGAITLTSALFADVIFLPALLHRFARPPAPQSGIPVQPGIAPQSGTAMQPGITMTSGVEPSPDGATGRGAAETVSAERRPGA